MRRLTAYSVLKIVTAIVLALNVAYASFLAWQCVQIRVGLLLSVSVYAGVTISAIVLNCVFAGYLALYMVFRRK